MEGADGTQTQASLDVTLSNILGVDVTVNYSTSDDTATAGQDYVAATDSVTVTAGETSAPLQVTVNGDDTDEGDETFTVTLSSAISNFGALGIDQPTGTVTILDDDGTIVAESTLRPALDDDEIAVAELRVERFKYEGGELTATLPGGVQSFDATLTYDTKSSTCARWPSSKETRPSTPRRRRDSSRSPAQSPAPPLTPPSWCLPRSSCG